MFRLILQAIMLLLLAYYKDAIINLVVTLLHPVFPFRVSLLCYGIIMLLFFKEKSHGKQNSLFHESTSRTRSRRIAKKLNNFDLNSLNLCLCKSFRHFLIIYTISQSDIWNCFMVYPAGTLHNIPAQQFSVGCGSFFCKICCLSAKVCVRFSIR